MRARKPIAKGDEITMRYRDITNPFSVRQADIKDGYYFTCTCEKCVEGGTLPEDSFAKSIESGLSPEWCRRADELMQKQQDDKLDVSWYRVGNNSTLAERRMTALQAEAFRPWAAMKGLRRQFRGDVPVITLLDLETALRLCMESGMWSLTRQPVPDLLRSLFAAYMEAGDAHRCLHIGLKKYFIVDPVITPQPFDYGRIVDAWALNSVATAYSNPAKQGDAEKLSRAGCDPRMLFLGVLMEVWENLPKSYGRDSQLGQSVGKVWHTCVGEAEEPPKELKDQWRAAYPMLRAYAEKIDLLKL